MIILLILAMMVIFIVIVYFAKRSGLGSKKHEEGRDLVKEAAAETKTGLSVDAVSVTVKRGLGFGPIECPSCGRYITEPLETRDSKNDALVMVCPYCGSRI